VQQAACGVTVRVDAVPLLQMWGKLCCVVCRHCAAHVTVDSDALMVTVMVVTLLLLLCLVVVHAVVMVVIVRWCSLSCRPSPALFPAVPLSLQPLRTAAEAEQARKAAADAEAAKTAAASAAAAAPAMPRLVKAPKFQASGINLEELNIKPVNKKPRPGPS
jgi:hypothetical protein